jgi:DNA helicase II / ATP-dependent DNA helicase PcrA
MPSANRIIVSAAGGGKTTNLVNDVIGERGSKCALITYTVNNQKEIHRHFYKSAPALPSHVEVLGWFTFLLRELARPYRAFLHSQRIEGISWQEGRSVPYEPQSNTGRHYFHDGRQIYSDKIAKFVCECDRISSGLVTQDEVAI